MEYLIFSAAGVGTINFFNTYDLQQAKCGCTYTPILGTSMKTIKNIFELRASLLSSSNY